MLGLTAFIGLTAACWRTGQDRGIVVAIVLTTIMVYYANRLRSNTPLLPTTLIALPMIAIGVFVIALLTGLRHPPLMAPPSWQWPPFASIKERVAHAFALAIWTFIFGTPTMLVLGLVRRLFAVICLTTGSEKVTATKFGTLGQTGQDHPQPDRRQWPGSGDLRPGIAPDGDDL